MYCYFYGFTEKPFEATSDPKFLYLNSAHREILASLLYGIESRRGFVTLIGEAGTGKTTLLKAAMERLPVDTKTAFIFNTNFTFKQMLLKALMHLGIIKSQLNCTKADALDRLNDFAVSSLGLGGNIVFMIDEAQYLNWRSLENLRFLSNMETHKHKLLQIVLSGQPELDAKLTQPKLQQLNQRISLRLCVPTLTEEEIYDYISHRLSVSNYIGPPIFSRQSQKLILRYSKGIPRKINIICDNALMIGYATEKKTIDENVIKEVIRNLTSRFFTNYEELTFLNSIQERSYYPDM